MYRKVRRFITGVNAGGSSCIIEESAITDARVQRIFETATTPPPARPMGSAPVRDLGLAPGLVRWVQVNFPPEAGAESHHTDSLDFVTVASGYVDLLLDDGAHRLHSGDSVAVAGVDHGWKAGPQGCVLSVVEVGTPPR
jgi:quercetin dioxygenase-like cupin family protein